MLLTLIDYATTTVISWGFFLLALAGELARGAGKFSTKKLRNLTDDHQILATQID